MGKLSACKRIQIRGTCKWCICNATSLCLSSSQNRGAGAGRTRRQLTAYQAPRSSETRQINSNTGSTMVSIYTHIFMLTKLRESWLCYTKVIFMFYLRSVLEKHWQRLVLRRQYSDIVIYCSVEVTYVSLLRFVNFVLFMQHKRQQCSLVDSKDNQKERDSHS